MTIDELLSQGLPKEQNMPAQSLQRTDMEKCPYCGDTTYVRCGAVGLCHSELCPSNDNNDYG